MDDHTLSKVISKKAHKRKIIMSTITLVALFIAVIPLAIMVIKSSYAAEDLYGKMIIIGDSYSRGYMPVNGQYTDVYESSWPNKMMAKLGSGSMIGDDLGRRGGAGFCANGSGNYGSDHEVTFVRQLIDFTTDKNVMSNASAVKYIVALGGYNDATGYTFDGTKCDKQMTKNEISKFATIARAHFPNAKIVIGMAGWDWQRTGNQNLINNIALAAYKDAADENGLYYVDGIEDVIKNSSYDTGDGVHPNVAGQEQIAIAISNYLKNDASASASPATPPAAPASYIKAAVSGNNGVHMTNSSSKLSFDAADPYMIKDGDYYYVYSTDRNCHKSKDLITWEGCTGTIKNEPSGTNYVWAPEVYKIGDTYYMFASFITWGSGYPYCSNSNGFVGVASTKNLDSGFTYLGKIDSKISQLGFPKVTCNSSDASHYNYNFIDGNLLIDGGRYYLYYKADHDQDIYAIELAYNSSNTNPFATISSRPTKIAAKEDVNVDKWGNGVAEAPEVWKHHGYYSMLYSSGNFKGDEYPANSYALGYAWASAPLGTWVNQSTAQKFPFLKGSNTFNVSSSYGGKYTLGKLASETYAPGHNSIFRIYDDNTNNTSEWYNVYHSAQYKNDSSFGFNNRKLNFQRMGTSNGAVYSNGVNNNYQPLISGTKYNDVEYTALRGSSMTIKVNGNNPTCKKLQSGGANDCLVDGAIFNATSGEVQWWSPQVKGADDIKITLNGRYNLSDIWISTDGASLVGNSATVYINEDDANATPYYFEINDFKNLLGDNAYKKIQLPDVSEKIGGFHDIRIKLTKSVDLTEVTAVRKGTNTYGGSITDNTANVSVNYDGKGHTINPKFTPSNGTVKYSTDGSTYNLASPPNFTNVGTHTVYYQVSHGGYNTLKGSKTVTINGLTITDNSSDVTVNYDGKEHTITTKFTPSDVTVMYSTDGKTYNITSIPKYKDVGDYNIFYKVSKVGYNDLSDSKTVHIYGIKGFKEGIKVKNNIIIAEWGSDFAFVKDKIIVHADNYSVEHRDINNQIVESNVAKTTDKIKIIIGNYKPEYLIVIRGDVNGDGEIGIIDYIRIKKDIMDIEKLSGIYFEAADMNNNSVVDIVDYIRIKKIIMEAES